MSGQALLAIVSVAAAGVSMALGALGQRSVRAASPRRHELPLVLQLGLEVRVLRISLAAFRAQVGA